MLKYIFSSLRNAIRSLICHKEVDGGLSDFQRNKNQNICLPCLFLFSMHSDPGTPQSGPGTPHSDGEASGRENQSEDEKWGGEAKSDQSEDEEEKRHYSDEEGENSDDQGPRNRKSGTTPRICR